MNRKLAVDGGKPVRQTLLPYARQLVDEEDVQAVAEVLRSDWLTAGPKVDEYEERFAEYVGAKYAIAFSSGTAALHAATFVTGLGPGDEVITTPLTFVATANSILYQQALPVFADIQSTTLNIDPARIAASITPQTKAIIPVDYAGHPCDLDAINEIAVRHRLVVIEDAAHGLGAVYKKRRVGTMATLTIFSTHPIKHITTGEGGVVTTNDPELARQLKIFRNHGITSEARERQKAVGWFYEMISLGYNYRITDVQCALGLSQLEKLDPWLTRRRQIAAQYTKAFLKLPEIQTPVVDVSCDPAWHLYVIRLGLKRLRVGRDVVFRALRAENIGVNVHYIPVPWHSYYQQRGYVRGQWPVAENAYEELISLPIFAGITDTDVADVIEAVYKVIQAYHN
jgi:perosamine synthetase